MKHLKNLSAWLLVTLAATGLLLTGCAGPKPKPGDVFPCVKAGKLDTTIAPEAEIEDFSCVFKRFEGCDVLHFFIKLKNISSEEQRFKVNIFLDNDKAVGGASTQNNQKRTDSTRPECRIYLPRNRHDGSTQDNNADCKKQWQNKGGCNDETSERDTVSVYRPDPGRTSGCQDHLCQHRHRRHRRHILSLWRRVWQRSGQNM